MAVRISCLELSKKIKKAADESLDVASSLHGNSFGGHTDSALRLRHFEKGIQSIIRFDPSLGGDREKWELMCSEVNSRLAEHGSTPVVVQMCGKEMPSFHSAALWFIEEVRSKLELVVSGRSNWRSSKKEYRSISSKFGPLLFPDDSMRQRGFSSGLQREAMEVAKDNPQKRFRFPAVDGEKDPETNCMPDAQFVWLKERDAERIPWRTTLSEMKLVRRGDWLDFESAPALGRRFGKECEKQDVRPASRDPGRPKKI